jgi:hypothetical protein
MADITASEPSDSPISNPTRRCSPRRATCWPTTAKSSRSTTIITTATSSPRGARDAQKRGQPDTVFNRYRKAINGTLGVLEDGQTDPRAYGRNPGVDEDSADVVTKTLRSRPTSTTSTS